MAVKAIIFDFDGTLADTYHAFVEIANSLSGEFGYKPVNSEDLEKLKHLSVKELIKQSEISPLKIPFVLNRVTSELRHKIQELKPINGIPNFLKELKENGYLLGIITSNRQENVLSFLKSNNLGNLFEFIYSGTTLFGKHKVINQLLKEHKLIPSEIIYVGDETRDIRSAQKSNVKVIAVAWGFNSPEILAQHQPDFLIYHPQELMRAIQDSE
ncbi:HAD hydrolase-like protein [Aphanothece sacrum]|uniref:Haloacid dehalogenase n=1 Tax=Aphanothece sacrum FPU1 TaxID=1920663 RepID=A0A401IBT3_APHSA|nr:HAD hydrolase-like protein [Aphanothece sacrum]GBF78702.1 haloacid dehalogenase [Aphanothece sacrum FPU1]GBF84991.1 haloacid dehalogenase [Aphanothece sacrum FPU3]